MLKCVRELILQCLGTCKYEFLVCFAKYCMGTRIKALYLAYGTEDNNVMCVLLDLVSHLLLQ